MPTCDADDRLPPPRSGIREEPGTISCGKAQLYVRHQEASFKAPATVAALWRDGTRSGRHQAQLSVGRIIVYLLHRLQYQGTEAYAEHNGRVAFGLRRFPKYRVVITFSPIATKPQPDIQTWPACNTEQTSRAVPMAT